MTPKPIQKPEIQYDKKMKLNRLRITDKDVFPLILDGPDGTSRTLHYKRAGKKGPCLYMN